MGEFHVGGHVPLTAEAYVDRNFVDDVFGDVLAGRWVLLLAPRQNGKTSALVRIVERLRSSGIAAARLTTQTLPEAVSLERVYEHFGRSLARQFNVDLVEPTGADREEIEPWLAKALPNGDAPCIVVLDEAAGITDEVVRGTFYRQLRALHDARDQPWSSNLGSGLSWLFAGTFSPQKLVEDSLTSPFNVCVLHRAPELTRDEVHELLVKVGREDLGNFVEPVMAAVGGQPYLVQALLSAAAAGDTGVTADDRFSRALLTLSTGASPHLQGLLSSVVSDGDVRTIASELAVAEDGIRYRATPAHDFLEVCGLAKLDEDGQLRLRNEIYAAVARAHPLLAAQPSTEVVATAAASPTPEAMTFMADEDLARVAAEMSDAGFAAMREGRHRIAVIAMGSAAEALLIDLLESSAQTDLQSAVTAQGPKFSQYENPAHPATWRLVNLMKVAHAHPRLAGAELTVSDALRDWRNLVHPAVSREKKLADADLAPEATAASGLLGILIRELSRT
jgi:hypothetical protein